MSTPRVIAFYLPQFHPTPDNDKWWGKGFTEWTNVAKARPLFPGHYQPHLPADLGFYDLRLPQVREEQCALAREAGVDGFCYWSYWFGNGKEELELPFNEVLASGKPDFPFMLCWANESWHSKFWKMDGSIEKTTLVEQTYPGDEDIDRHFYHRLPAFRDHRYIKVDGKPVFMVYNYEDHPQMARFISRWNELARKEGMPGIYFIAHIKLHINRETFAHIRSLGFDAINTCRIWDAEERRITYWSKTFRRWKAGITGYPKYRDYGTTTPLYFTDEDRDPTVFPTLIPNWDHSPRSGKAGVILHDSTPEKFKLHALDVLSGVREKPGPNFVFIRAWNEWGEGNHMEPDLRFGKGFIRALAEARKATD